MVKMIALKAHTYGGKTIKADEEFEVEERFVGTLTSLARARRADVSTKVAPVSTKRSEAKAEGEAKPAEEKSRYSTRQMKADK